MNQAVAQHPIVAKILFVLQNFSGLFNKVQVEVMEAEAKRVIAAPSRANTSSAFHRICSFVCEAVGSAKTPSQLNLARVWFESVEDTCELILRTAGVPADLAQHICNPQDIAEMLRELHRKAKGVVERKNAAVFETFTNSEPVTINKLQQWQKAWVDYNFPNQPKHHALLGVQEEVGELAHAHLKAEQGIRGTPAEHRAAKEDAAADILIFLLSYCNAEDINLESCVMKAWTEVSQRDWQKYPKTGRPEQQASSETDQVIEPFITIPFCRSDMDVWSRADTVKFIRQEFLPIIVSDSIDTEELKDRIASAILAVDAVAKATSSRHGQGEWVAPVSQGDDASADYNDDGPTDSDILPFVSPSPAKNEVA